MKAPFPYFGGKMRLAPQIADLLGPHRVYLEPYAGSGAVLFAKAPARHEILNDRNGAIVAFFRVLRDRPDELEHALRLTPYARDEYLSCPLDEPGLEDLELARRFFVRAVQSVGGIVVDGRINWSGAASTGSSRASQMVRKVDSIPAFAARLRGVVIDNRDAVEAIRHYANGPDAVIYADPPYLGTTRSGIGGYHHDAPDEEHHRDLAKALHETDALVVVSGYASELYDELFGDWHRIDVRVLEAAGVRSAGDPRAHRTETLWLNRDPHDGRLFR